MSKTAVIVALLVAVVLGVAALVLLKEKAQPAKTGSLLTFDPAAVTEIRMDLSDGSSQSVRRAAGGWTVVLSGPGQPDRSWPAAETQVHSALRIFAALAPEQPADGSIGKPAGTLTIKSGDAFQVLKIGDQRLAGRVLVESNRAAWVDADLAEMLITTGIRAWRNRAALPGVGPDASRVSIQGHTGAALTLARVQGKWFIREPIAEPADPDAIARLFGVLAAARIEDFCDAGPPTATGLDKPVARLTIETDSRDPSGKASTVRHSLVVGQAADIALKNVVARLERAGSDRDYAETFILAGEQLAAIKTDAALYLSKRPVSGEAAEIGQVSLAMPRVASPCDRQAYRRTLEGWEHQCGDAAWGPALVANVQPLTALLELLTTANPEKIMLRVNGSDPETAVKVELASLGGAPIGRVAVVIDSAKLVVLTEKVRREYATGVGAAVAEWLGQK